MIVRNEEQTLPRALESIHGLVDHLYLTDTGSTDSTIAIAKSFGATIRHFTWIDDFSAARNISISGIPADWILVLDADEYFPVPPADVIRPLLESTTHLAWNLQHHLAPDHTPAPSLRIFRNHSGIRYQGFIHESLRDSVKSIPGATIGHLPVALFHTGYSPDLEHKKSLRNEPLLRREWLRAQATDDFTQLLYVGHSLAASLIGLNRSAEAESLLHQLLERLRSAGSSCAHRWEIVILVRLVSRLLEQDRAAAAVSLCAQTTDIFPGDPLHALYHGLALFHQGDLSSALPHLERAELLAHAHPPVVSIPEDLLTLRLWEMLGHCYLHAQDPAAATPCFLRCATHAPANPAFQVKATLAQRLLHQSA